MTRAIKLWRRPQMLKEITSRPVKTAVSELGFRQRYSNHTCNSTPLVSTHPGSQPLLECIYLPVRGSAEKPGDLFLLRGFPVVRSKYPPYVCIENPAGVAELVDNIRCWNKRMNKSKNKQQYINHPLLSTLPAGPTDQDTYTYMPPGYYYNL